MFSSANVPAGRIVKLSEAFQLAVIGNIANFSGRSSRGAYWWFQLATFLIAITLGVIDGLVFADAAAGASGGPIGQLFSLAMVIPSVSIGFRRMHDVGRSGWWALLPLPLWIIGAMLVFGMNKMAPAGFVALAVAAVAQAYVLYLLSQPGERGDNDFGPDEEAGRWN